MLAEGLCCIVERGWRELYVPVRCIATEWGEPSSGRRPEGLHAVVALRIVSLGRQQGTLPPAVGAPTQPPPLRDNATALNVRANNFTVVDNCCCCGMLVPHAHVLPRVPAGVYSTHFSFPVLSCPVSAADQRLYQQQFPVAPSAALSRSLVRPPHVCRMRSSPARRGISLTKFP